MKKLYMLLIMLTALSCMPSTVFCQSWQPDDTVAEETLTISASSATVLQWFDKIEKECNIILSYNPSTIDLDKKVSISISGKTTVGRLLKAVLTEYDVRMTAIPPRKIALQVTKKVNICISGTVYEEESNERLYGAIIRLDRGDGHPLMVQTDVGGSFRLYAPRGSYKLTVSYVGYAPSPGR